MKSPTRAILIASVFLFVFTACAKKSERTIAEVNGKKISFEDFKNRYEMFLLSTGIKDTYPNRRNILNSMITEILLYDFDDNSSVFKNEEYQKEKRWVADQTVLGYLQDREVFAKLTASDEELRKAFLRLNQRVAARHLYASTLQEANELYDLLKSGADFELLAKQVFTDSLLRNNGGYLGYFTWGDMDPNFEDAAFSLKIGEISKPVKTEQGYSIIKVEDRITKPIITEDEFLRRKNQVKRLLLIRKKRPALRKFLNETIKLDEIKFDDEAVNEIADKFKLYLKKGEIPSDFTDNDKIVSDYRGKTFTVAEALYRLEQIPYYHRKKIKTAGNVKTAIKGFYLHDELLKTANEKGYNEAEAVKKKTAQQQINLFMRYKMIEITKNAELSDSLVRAFYDDNKSYFSTHDEYNIREIIVARKSLADSLLRVLKKRRELFPQLARKFSLRKYTAENGGELGYAPITKFGLLRKTLAKSNVGDLIGPVKISDLYGIFEVLGKKDGKVIPYEEIKDEAKQAAKFYYRKKIFKEYVQKIYDKNEIRINEDLLKNARFPE